ncbi:MAG: response regulator [Proteobacteria bacterium]|nr:response regulator [Pseudomonadota bacterium]MBU1738470.1 response regulator [Pseudomonadota bacterium]
MPGKFFRSIQGKVLTGLSIIFLCSVLALFTSMNTTLKNSILIQESHIIRNYASSVAGKLNHNLAQAAANLEAVARTTKVRSMDRSILDPYLQEVSTISPFFLWHMVMDHNGTVISRHSKPERRGADRSDRDYFRVPMFEQKSMVSETQVSRSGNLSVHIATPIVGEDGAPLGVLSAPIGFADRNPILYNAITRASLPDEWQVFLVDKRGLLIAHSHQTIDRNNLQPLDFSTHPAVSTMLAGGNVSRLDRYFYQGEEWYSSASEVELSGWTVFVQAPKRIIAGHVNDVIRPATIFISTFLILLLICSVLAARSYFRPLINLTHALDRFGKKEEVEPLATKGTGEVSDAILAFNSMIRERAAMERELLATGKIESLGHLAGGIAHDFNNILTAISTTLSLTRTHHRDPELFLDKLTACENAVMRARGLTQQLLTFSKGGAPIKKSSPIDEIIADSAGFVLSGKDIRVNHQFPSDLWPVDIDPDQISQVIQNLVLNAEEASPKGGIISITARNVTISERDTPALKPGNYVLVSVIDKGKGIGRDEQQNIFDPYFSTKGSGRGLGLAACYSIIRNHGGLIGVESTGNKGTIFNIYLPAAAFPPNPGPAESLPTGEKSGGRILIMDDEELIRESLAEIIMMYGHDAETAPDGETTIRKYREEMEKKTPFDLLIMDLTIPGGMGGIETLQRLREIDPDVQAIVSSGYSNDPVISRFREYGFCDILPKPFKGADLIATINRHLAEG